MLSTLRNKTLQAVSRLAVNRNGNFGIITAMVAPALLMAGGVAVNVAHIYNTRTVMSQTLDIALTSTTRDVVANGKSRNAAMDSMNAYVMANGNGGLSEADKLRISRLDIDRTARTVTANLSADVQMPFSLFGLAKSFPVTVNAVSTYTDRPVEVAMMLDLTGSMNEAGTRKNGKSQTKLDNLKDAASAAIEDMLSRNQVGLEPRIRIALIPYSEGVNSGALSEGNYIEDSRITDVPIGLDDLNAPVNALIKLILSILRPSTDKCTTERKRANGWSTTADMGETPPTQAMVNRDDRLGRNRCPTSAIVPLTADKKRLLDEVKNFTGGGNTAGHIGVQWTRYLLSPEWGSFLRQKVDPTAVPAPYASGPTSIRKVAILLTDGEFNQTYSNGGSSAAMAQAHCTALKQNVEVFTVGFMLDDNAAKATMANCASPDVAGGIKHSYTAENAAELLAVFQLIAANTEAVRLAH